MKLASREFIEMSGDNDDKKDFDDLMQAIREYGDGDDGLSDDDSLDDLSMPSYEYDWNVHESETNIWTWDPNLSVDEMSWNNTPFANVEMFRNNKSHHNTSANSASNDILEPSVYGAVELEDVHFELLDLMVTLTILLPLVAYFIYQVLQLIYS